MKDLFSKRDIIYAVYQERSFSKAAQKLFISQPSLSVMIKKIEDDIGMPLFDRSCKPIRMTEAGMEYIRATEAIRHTERAFINYIDASNGQISGTLTLGANQLFSSLVLPSYISRFIARYPNVSLNLVDNNSTNLNNMISAGLLDLMIDNQKLDDDVFEQRLLRTEHLLLAVPAAFSCNRGLEKYQMQAADILADHHLSADMPGVPLDAFAGVPFVPMTRDNDTRQRTDAIFRDAEHKPSTLFEVDRLVTLYNFVEIGTAASVVSDTLVKHTHYSSEHVVFYRFSSPHAVREIYVSYKRNKYYSNVMQAFVNLLMEG